MRHPSGGHQNNTPFPLWSPRPCMTGPARMRMRARFISGAAQAPGQDQLMREGLLVLSFFSFWRHSCWLARASAFRESIVS